jgi:hypothetical protein
MKNESMYSVGQNWGERNSLSDSPLPLAVSQFKEKMKVKQRNKRMQS